MAVAAAAGESTAMTAPRLALAAMEKTLSRRAMLMNIGKGLGVVAAYDRFGPSLFGATPQTDRQNYLQALQIFGAYGRLVIPVDQDPGWATFEPEITVYGLDVFIRQVFNLGHDLAFNGFTQAVVAFNEHTSELQSHSDLVCRLLLEKKKTSTHPSR